MRKVSEKCHIEGLLDIKSPQTPFIVYYPGTLSLQGHIIFTKFPASINLPEEQILWVPLCKYGHSRGNWTVPTFDRGI